MLVFPLKYFRVVALDEDEMMRKEVLLCGFDKMVVFIWNDVVLKLFGSQPR